MARSAVRTFHGLAIGTLACGLLAAQPADALDIPSIARAAAEYHSSNPRLEMLYRSALLNTTHQAVIAADGTAYVKTGDIPAEWLRDASAQVRPYLYFAKSDPKVAALLRAIIARQAKYLQLDPYANAFTLDYRVWEQKFELDSLAYPVILAWSYWKTTGDAAIFTGDLSLAFDRVLATMKREQDHPALSTYKHVQLGEDGRGSAVGYTGMIWSGFRPSDDACTYHFLIPSEMMAVVALGDLEEIERTVYRDREKAFAAGILRQQVRNGIEQYGVVFSPVFGYVYAYEVNGLGDAILTDDANVPSLLSAPYLGYVRADNRFYKNTRRFLLSKSNPTFYAGSVARGIGSYHTADGWVWPLALVMQGLTATSASEKDDALAQIVASDPGDHLLHEAFDPNDPRKYTRQDFGWPNALFSEFVLTVLEGRPAAPMSARPPQ